MASIYSLPSQIQDEFENLVLSFEQFIVDNIVNCSLFVFSIGDFNVRTTNWQKKTFFTSDGTRINSLTCSYGANQIISNLTHILQIHPAVLILSLKSNLTCLSIYTPLMSP